LSISVLEPLGVPPQMLVHEGGNEEVAVVIAGLEPQRQPDAGLVAGCLQQVGSQLLGQKRIRIPDVGKRIFSGTYQAACGM
jgi:hypothetical protein